MHEGGGEAGKPEESWERKAGGRMSSVTARAMKCATRSTAAGTSSFRSSKLCRQRRLLDTQGSCSI